MNNTVEDIDLYLEKTGQSRQDLLAGAQAFGVQFIYDNLIPRALKENKKIVWKDEPSKGLDAVSYTLEDI